MRSNWIFPRTLTATSAMPLAVILALLGAATPAHAESVTYARDVAPILQENCQECHRPGEAVPMTVMNYKETRPWAKSIKRVVQNGEMPPWHADPSVGEWINERGLTEKEVQTIVAWVDAGAPMGNAADLPPAREYDEGWKIGEPDAVFTFPKEVVLPADFKDDFRYVMIPTGLKEAKWVQAAEVRPGNYEVVHHAITFVTTFSKLMGSGGTENLGEGQHEAVGNFELDSTLGGYAPGTQPFIMPEGTAMFLPAGAVIVMQMHYNKEPSMEARDRTSIGLVYSDKPVEKMMRIEPAANENFLIPAGAENHEVLGVFTADEDVTIQRVMPHLHLRGVAMDVWVEYPDGRTEDILLVPNYDFDWQTIYQFREPLSIPKGAEVHARARFDNSANNPFNPDPTANVGWGLKTEDEMMYAFLIYTRDAEDLSSLDPNAVQLASAGGE